MKVTLSEFLSVHVSAAKGLQNLNIPDLGDFLLLTMALYKLPAAVRLDYDQSLGESTVPKFEHMIEFITRRARTLDVLDGVPSTMNNKERDVCERSGAIPKDARPVRRAQPRAALSTVMSTAQREDATRDDCYLCRGDHRIYSCGRYQEMTVAKGKDAIKRHAKCFACLQNHSVRHCKTQKINAQFVEHGDITPPCVSDRLRRGKKAAIDCQRPARMHRKYCWGLHAFS